MCRHGVRFYSLFFADNLGSQWYLRITFRSHRRHFQLKTQNHGELFALMNHIVVGDDPAVKNGKPSPDIFLAAAKRFQSSNEIINPSGFLVFEDAPSGVAAAKNAGM